MSVLRLALAVFGFAVPLASAVVLAGSFIGSIPYGFDFLVYANLYGEGWPELLMLVASVPCALYDGYLLFWRRGA